MRTSIVIDYQNIHLVGWEACRNKVGPKHECAIHPLRFALELLSARNANQRPGFSPAQLADVWVYRGLPQAEYDPEQNSWNLAQQATWESDSRVHVTHRPLRYQARYAGYSTQSGATAGGRQRETGSDGRWLYVSRQEKGIDVLCALRLVTEAAREDIDLVILASHDTDLEPALDHAIDVGSTKIETMRWDGSTHRQFVKQLKASRRNLWNTKLGPESFERCVDPATY